jgi:hypothetical protein
MYETDAEGNVWSKPLTHFDRSTNCLHLSLDDLRRMCKLAKEHPALHSALSEAKMLYLLIGDPRRKDDSLCFPRIVKTADGRRVT